MQMYTVNHDEQLRWLQITSRDHLLWHVESWLCFTLVNFHRHTQHPWAGLIVVPSWQIQPSKDQFIMPNKNPPTAYASHLPRKCICKTRWVHPNTCVRLHVKRGSYTVTYAEKGNATILDLIACLSMLSPTQKPTNHRMFSSTIGCCSKKYTSATGLVNLSDHSTH